MEIDFIKKYEEALASQKWEKVKLLILENACVTFSDGSVHFGIENIQIAFERNFSIIKNEKFEIKNIRWLKKNNVFAVYVFDFEWKGIINNQIMSGRGIGTSSIINDNGNWKLLSEHLGKK